MKLVKWLSIAAFAASLVACGGGGGSAGTTTTSGTGANTQTTTVAVAAVPTIELSIVDGSGVVVTSNSITGGTRKVRARLLNAAGAPVGLELVNFSPASAAFGIVTPASGQVLTNASGIAEVLIQPAAINVSGASSVSVNATVGGTPVSGVINIQASTSNVGFGVLVPNSANLAAYQSTVVEVSVFVDSIAANSGQVNVNFASPCGSFAPTTVPTNSVGKAVTTFTSAGCAGGTVTLRATAAGAVDATANVAIQPAAPTNLAFVSATPSTIYSQQALFGVKQSTIRFQLVDSAGTGIDGETVLLNISGAAQAAGVVFANNGLSTTTQATAGGGFVTVQVRSGDVPAPVTVEATLVSNASIKSASGGLAVNSGAPVQTFMSLSASSFNIEGWGYDGELSSITVFAADRLGQPVPNGTVISFITEGGQITPSCATTINTNGKSGCVVSLQSQNFRPTNGRVSILAYAEGLEPFIDSNGDNRFSAAEAFADLGQPFLDANENGIFDGVDQLIGNGASAGVGTLACAAVNPQFGYAPPSAPNTCNSQHGKSLIRSGAVIAFSTSFVGNASLFGQTASSFNVTLPDENGNAMPSGTALSDTINGGVQCFLDRIVPANVPSTPNPTSHTIVLKKADPVANQPVPTCSGAVVRVVVTTPRGNATLLDPVTMP